MSVSIGFIWTSHRSDILENEVADDKIKVKEYIFKPQAKRSMQIMQRIDYERKFRPSPTLVSR